MFKILKTTENNLTVIPGVVEGAWVHVVNPTPEEFEKTYGLGIPQKFITAPLDLNEKPHIEQQAGSTLILLRMPYYRVGGNAPYATIPLGIILCNGFIITITRYHNPLLEIKGRKSRNFSTNKCNRFVLQIFSAIVNDYLFAIQLISQDISNDGKTFGFCQYRQDLELLTNALKLNEQVFEKIQCMGFFRAFSNESDLLGDVIAKNQYVIEISSSKKQLLNEKTQ